MLSPLQKMAWFNLIVFAGAVVVYLVAVLVLAFVGNVPLDKAALPALGVFGLCGVWGFGGTFLRDRKTKKKRLLDERDQLIYRRAINAGWTVFWGVFVLVCMGIWGVIRYVKGRQTVPVDLLPGLVFLGMMVATVTQSVVILMQYGRSTSGE